MYLGRGAEGGTDFLKKEGLREVEGQEIIFLKKAIVRYLIAYDTHKPRPN